MEFILVAAVALEQVINDANSVSPLIVYELEVMTMASLCFLIVWLECEGRTVIGENIDVILKWWSMQDVWIVGHFAVYLYTTHQSDFSVSLHFQLQS